MANLIAEVQGNRGKVHRLGSQTVYSRLATWTHEIITWLDKDGNYKVEIYKIHHANATKTYEGNIMEDVGE